MGGTAPTPATTPLSGAEARQQRATLFGVTLSVGLFLLVTGFLNDLTVTTREATVRLLGHSLTMPLGLFCWVLAIYPFTLAYRAIWLPDDRLRKAERNLWLLTGGVAITLVVRGVIWSITHR